MNTITLVIILSGISALIINYNSSEEKPSILGFIIWFGISFAMTSIVFAAVKFIAQ